jgi:hypothetical protein
MLDEVYVGLTLRIVCRLVETRNSQYSGATESVNNQLNETASRAASMEFDWKSARDQGFGVAMTWEEWSGSR